MKYKAEVGINEILEGAESVTRMSVKRLSSSSFMLFILSNKLQCVVT